MTPKLSAQKQRRQQRLKDLQKGDVAPLDLSGLDAWKASKLLRRFPEGVYRDAPFRCHECGALEIWKAWQQKWWYETMRGDADSTAIHCRACRIRAREQRREARRVSEEGMRRKRGVHET
jgi:hypothetical protein